MVLFNKITGQKRKTGISCHVFSFQQSLSFVERFVEKMLSLKYLIFNTSFIIFNNSTKLYAIKIVFRYSVEPAHTFCWRVVTAVVIVVLV